MEWFLAGPGITGKVGPLTEEDILSRISRGEIFGYHLVWRSGMPNWVEISSSPLAHLLTWSPPPAPQPGQPLAPQSYQPVPQAAYQQPPQQAYQPAPQQAYYPTPQQSYQPVPQQAYHPAVHSNCPICDSAPVDPMPLYGMPTCKKCRKKLNNKRQIASIIDWFVASTPGLLIFLVVAAIGYEFLGLVILSALSGILFTFRDAFGGVSPGKALMGLQAIDATTGEPITPKQSVIRNVIYGAAYFFGAFTIVFGIAGTILLICASVQIMKGPRLGDRWANSRVVPKDRIRAFVKAGA